MAWRLPSMLILALIAAAAPGSRADERFCLTNAKTGVTLRGCEAYKAPADYYSTAVCTDPKTGATSEQTMSPEWQRTEEGTDRCELSMPAPASEEGVAPAGAIRTRSLPVVTASRIFSGPNKYPPMEFAAYGILAFRSRPSPYDRDRHLMFCHAYLAILPHASELAVPRSEQMVTVWPLNSNEASDRLNRLTNDAKGACPVAVDDYGLVIAQQALKEAELTGRDVSGGGPYLLAWSPAANKGKEDALVLVSDLSNITTYEQAKERFLAWSRDIESDPALWTGGWNLERLRVHIRGWVDKYGEGSLALLVR